MDNYWQNLQVIADGGGSEQARFYRGDDDWMLEDEKEDILEEQK